MQQRGDGRGQIVDGVGDEARLLRFDQLGQRVERAADDAQAAGRRLQQYVGQAVLTALLLAQEHEQVGVPHGGEHGVVGQRAAQHDGLAQPRGGNLRGHRLGQRAVADHVPDERHAAVPEGGGDGDEIVEAFVCDQPADREQLQRPRRPPAVLRGRVDCGGRHAVIAKLNTGRRKHLC